jgi:hypothetical protein
MATLPLVKSSNSSVSKRASESPNSKRLEQVLIDFGSDKAVMHDYWRSYERWMKCLENEEGALLEVGIGTNNPSIPSNMGGNFVSGGSLRAWSHYFPKFRIYGADIDTEILFEQGNIATCWVDQTKPGSFENIYKSFSKPELDFLIIDGLHQPYADILSLRKLLPLLKVKGHVFIEDVEESRLIKLVWGTVFKLLPRGFESNLIPHKGGLVVHIQRIR